MSRTADGRCNRWSAEEDEMLERLWRQGLSDRRIAEQIPGRTESAIETRRFTLDLIKETAGTPSRADLAERRRTLPRSSRPDLFAIWDARNTALRQRLQAQGLLPATDPDDVVTK